MSLPTVGWWLASHLGYSPAAVPGIPGNASRIEARLTPAMPLSVGDTVTLHLAGFSGADGAIPTASSGRYTHAFSRGDRSRFTVLPAAAGGAEAWRSVDANSSLPDAYQCEPCLSSFWQDGAALADGYYRPVCGKQGEELRRALHDLLITTHQSVGFGTGLLDAIAAVDGVPAQPSMVKLLHTEDGAEAHVNGSNGTDLAWTPGFAWPQALGVGHESYTCPGACASGNAMSDLHHQFAAGREAVAARMLPLDYTTPDGRVFRKTAMLYGECDARCQAPSTALDARQTYGWSPHTELLEPPPEVRGDVARALMYMAVRYDGDDGVVDLELKDFGAEEDPRCCRDDENYKGCSAEVCYMGQLSSLLAWHLADPVSEEERARNAMVQARFQGNRNPFVDLPQVSPDFGAVSNKLSL